MNKPEFNTSYITVRPDIQKLIPENAKVILDVGCSTGALGAAIKARTGAELIGIELSADMANVAHSQLDNVFIGDAADIISKGVLEGYRFDTIIFADVLEHLVDPWTVLNESVKYLTPEGIVIASIPNVRHIDTIFNLVVKGRWPYRKRGIHDKTHLRFFTKRNIFELFTGAGLTIEVVRTNYRFLDRANYFNRFARPLAIPGIRNFLAFQYLVRARLTKATIS